MTGQHRHGRHLSRATTLKRRLRRLFTVGSWIVAALYAIDPNWPLNLRRLVVAIVIWIRGSLGSYPK